MSNGDRAAALATACDDLQAQLEAGDRSMRHLDDDMLLLHDALQAAFAHAERIGSLRRHMRELRANMREQRQALREVRRAAQLLCESIARARDSVASLADETPALPCSPDIVAHDDVAANVGAESSAGSDYETPWLASSTTKRDPAT